MGFQPDEDILNAAVEAKLAKMQQALADGADVSIPNWPWQNTPLHLANCPIFWDSDTQHMERKIRLEMTQWLVRQGADMDAENWIHLKPIDMALFHRHMETVQWLKEQGCKFGWFGAAFAGDVGRIRDMLADGQDIDAKGRYGRTAWCEAKLRGKWQVQMLLSQCGCRKEMAHPEHIKFNAGGAAYPRSVDWGKR